MDDFSPLTEATIEQLAAEIQRRTRSGVIMITGVAEPGDRNWRTKKWGYTPEVIGMAESFAFDEKMLSYKDKDGDDDSLDA